jgi:hypothetical protein
MLWDQLSSEEFLLFLLSLKENDDMKFAFLKANILINRKILRERLIVIQSSLEVEPDSRIKYTGYKRMRIEIQRITRRLPKPKKFSGYVRNISQIGTKSRKTRRIETIANKEFIMKDEFNWYLAFTVGNLSDQE